MSEQWQVWDAEVPADRDAWIALWAASDERQPFAHPDVCSLLRPAEGRLMAVALSHGGGHVLYPFFLREISGSDGWRDIVSPYGYGGPMHWGLTDVEATAEVFWHRFDAWALEHSVVSEFSRLSLFGETLLPYRGATRKRQNNYVRDLSVSVEELGWEVAPKVRSNVRRARREGVTIVIDTDGEFVDDFVRIYTETMQRRDSADWYRFERPFFEGLHAALAGQFAYVYAELDGRLVSADLLLFGTDIGYYFLGGTEAAAFRARPNDLVKMESMTWLKARGCRSYVLGGGVTAAPDDSLDRYKRGFAPHGRVDYLTGERIISAPAYDALLAAHRQRLAARGLDFDESSDFFPAYRRGAELLTPEAAETAPSAGGSPSTGGSAPAALSEESTPARQAEPARS